MLMRRCAFLLLVTTLSACDRQTTPALSIPVDSAATAPCPAQTFEGFFGAFVEGVGVQREFTRFPLQTDSVDVGADPEPVTVTKMLSAEEVEFPLIPTKQQTAAADLEISISRTWNDTVVSLKKPDTDYQVFYYFLREGDCWQLYRKNDESL